tara:strand:+ start:2001 stop:2390 length:390 start_codon:yes stop_codon:yes gene_type:complete
MKTPLIPISWGELFDKITILQIKLENLQGKNALKNIKIEYDELFKIYNNNFLEDENAKRLLAKLKTINKSLWNIEDDIRDKERHKTFDEEFIELARNVYITNDERSRIKRNINETFGSQLIEEKSYSDY